MFSGDLSSPLFAGVVVAVVVLLAAWALGFLDPFEVDERIAQPPGQESLDSMAEWGSSLAAVHGLRLMHDAENARAAMNHANAMQAHGERIANAGMNIQAAIGARAARDSRVLGYHILDEGGDVDTKPPLNADQEAMLRKIDAVQLQVVTFDRWRDLGYREHGNIRLTLRDLRTTMPAFPVSLIGRGVSIPPAHSGEVLA